MEADFYPFAAAGTLPEHAEQAGAYHAPVTAVAFDALEELAYAGTEDGRLTALHAQTLERYAAVQAHPSGHPVLSATPVANGYGGVFTVSAARACYHSSGCVKRWGANEGELDPDDPYTCGAVDPHALGGSGRAYAGRLGPRMTQIDVGTAEACAVK